jgi:16S rRNA (guanine527-N7)-methyltransferase
LVDSVLLDLQSSHMTVHGQGPDLLESGLEMLGIAADSQVNDALLAFAAELKKWSHSYNLVSAGDREDLIVRHVLDSLSVQQWISESPLLDLGCGAGLPGTPLAIIRPAVKVTLLDGNGKKIRFCQHVQRKLDLPNVFPVHVRAEAFQPKRRFEQVISRAFASLSDFAALARHLLAPGGRMLAMKGHWPNDEISALPADIRVESVEPVNVPHLHAERHLVMMSVTASPATPRSSE